MLLRKNRPEASMSEGILVVVTLVLLEFSLGQNGCPYKECACYPQNNLIFCGNLGLEQPPTPVSTAASLYIYLTFDNNNITSIPAGSLPDGLKEISLLYNPVTSIADTAFDGSSSSLQTLYFSDAHFNQIPSALSHLNFLTTFSIQNSSIQDWNSAAMGHIGQSVTSLYLENVGLITWPDWLQSFTKLTDLTISRSSISSIPDGAFHNMRTSLKSLTLMYNNLTAVSKAFSELKSLGMLNVMNTRISDLTYLPQESLMTSLALDNTSLSNLTHLSTALQPYRNSLLNVHLQGCQVTSIPDLSSMTKLGSVDLAHNKIWDPLSGALPSSTYDVDLSYNLLASIPKTLANLTSMTSLQLPYNRITRVTEADFHSFFMFVDLGFNQISELTDTSFPAQAAIEILNLNNNPLSRISVAAFQRLSSLSQLSMRSTKLTRLPLALASLSNLKWLDVTDNTHLVCTCGERDLMSLIAQLNRMDGNCGVTTVSNFFITFGPMCPPVQH